MLLILLRDLDLFGLTPRLAMLLLSFSFILLFFFEMLLEVYLGWFDIWFCF